MTRTLPFLLLFLLAGCGSFLTSGRTLVYQSGTALSAADQVIAPAYGKAAAEALDASHSLEEYEAAMEPWNRLEEALRAAQEALEAFEHALDVYQAGSEGQVFRAVLGLLGVLHDVLDEASALGVELPREVVQLAGLLAEFSGQAGAEQ